MKTIRTSVFETNSSSVHTLCVPKVTPKTFKDEVYVDGGEFGWEIRNYYGIEDKLNYIYEAIVAYYYNNLHEDEELCLTKITEFCEHIVNLFKSYGLEITFGKLKHNSYGGYSTPADGYIDHSSDLAEFFEDIIMNDDYLVKFVFGGFIHTSNDNLYEGQDTFNSEDYKSKFYLYYKGN